MHTCRSNLFCWLRNPSLSTVKSPFLLLQIPISHDQIQCMITRSPCPIVKSPVLITTSPFPRVKSLVMIIKSPFFMVKSRFWIIESQFSIVESNLFDHEIPFLMCKSQYLITIWLYIRFLWSNHVKSSVWLIESSWNRHVSPMLGHSNPQIRYKKSSSHGDVTVLPVSAGTPLPKAFANSTLLPRTPFTSRIRSNSWMTTGWEKRF